MYRHSISESVRRENAVTLWTKEEARGLFSRVPSPNVEGATSLVGIPWFTEGDRLGGTIVMWFDDAFEPSSEQSVTLPLLGEVFSMALASVLASRKRAEIDERAVLSPREMQVIMLIYEGLSNKEISTALGISQNTAKEYTSSVMRKLGAKNRTEAAIKASRMGIIRQ